MYNPAHFAETDLDLIRQTIRQAGAGELISMGTDGLESSIVPLMLTEDGTRLLGHLARANGQWKRVDSSVDVLVSWRGPEAYVSPSYYPTKIVHGKVVPTWNYTVVQAKGRLIVHDDAEWVRPIVTQLTDLHEGKFEAPWSVDDAPSDYLDGMLKAIVGIEIEVHSVLGKNKVSQNRSEADIAGVVRGLRSMQQPDASLIADRAEAIGQAQQQQQQ
jgi:transcriptional regulator